MKQFKTLLSAALIALTACKSENNQDAPVETVEQQIQSTYCMDFSLVDSELTLQSMGGGQYQIEILDHDGGLRSGTATGALEGRILTMTGEVTIEMGTAPLSASIEFSQDYQSFQGNLDVLGPDNAAMMSSTMRGRAGACEYEYDVSDLAAVSSQQLLDSLHVDLSKIEQISLYRSAAGHNFVDYSGESCVNLKHYFRGYSTVTNVDYYAPAAGTIVNINHARPHVDMSDLEIDIQLYADPNIIVRIFHTTLENGLELGSHVESGDHIGDTPEHHDHKGDLAIYVKTSDGYRHISAFEIMTSGVLAQYEARGVSTSDWQDDLYLATDDPYVAGIYCENGDWGNLRHPNMNAPDDWFVLNP